MKDLFTHTSIITQSHTTPNLLIFRRHCAFYAILCFFAWWSCACACVVERQVAKSILLCKHLIFFSAAFTIDHNHTIRHHVIYIIHKKWQVVTQKFIGSLAQIYINIVFLFTQLQHTHTVNAENDWWIYNFILRRTTIDISRPRVFRFLRAHARSYARVLCADFKTGQNE